MPFFSFTLHLVVPIAGTLVRLFTPFPNRWKLWMFDLSWMTIVYAPGFTVVLFIVIVNPGPSVPDRMLLRAPVAAGKASAAAVVPSANAVNVAGGGVSMPPQPAPPSEGPPEAIRTYSLPLIE